MATLHSGIRPQTPVTDFYEANRKYTSTNPEIEAQILEIRYDYKVYTWERFGNS